MMKDLVKRVEDLLISNTVEISRLNLSNDEFAEEAIWCLDHHLTKDEIVAHFNYLIADHNDEFHSETFYDNDEFPDTFISE
jgi:hypothetical protein